MIRRESILLLVFLPACGSSASSPSPPADAGGEDAPVETGPDGTGFPIDDSGPPADGGNECDRMRAEVNALGLAARGCNPQGANECGAAVDGVCCQLSVSISSTQAVNDFQQAVMAYKTKCQPKCTSCLPEPVPSGVCEGSGNNGTCR